MRTSEEREIVLDMSWILLVILILGLRSYSVNFHAIIGHSCPQTRNTRHFTTDFAPIIVLIDRAIACRSNYSLLPYPLHPSDPTIPAIIVPITLFPLFPPRFGCSSDFFEFVLLLIRSCYYIDLCVPIGR